MPVVEYTQEVRDVYAEIHSERDKIFVQLKLQTSQQGSNEVPDKTETEHVEEYS